MDVQLNEFPVLEGNRDVDVCIVGAGICGLTCAYTLAKAGKSVVVLDKGAIGGGQTARTTAHLTWALDDRYFDLEKMFGKKGAKLAAESHNAAIDYIEKIVLAEKIDCDFERVNGYLFVPPKDPKDVLDKELKAIKHTGLKIKKLDNFKVTDSFNLGPCLEFENQGQFHILKYLQGLTKAIINHGGEIFSHTHVKKVEEGVVKTSSHKIKAKSVIVTTCTPVNDRYMIHTKQAAYRTYVIAAGIPKDTVPKALYWDTPDPYHYFRLQKNLFNPTFDWLIIGGEDHRTGQENADEIKYGHLEDWARERFPSMGPVEYKWSGQVFEPVDSLAYIGQNPHDKHIYIATGDSGNGLTHGTISGILIPDLILGIKNPWKELYKPSRKTLTAAPDFIEENFNTMTQYRDWLTPGNVKKIESLGTDQGVILRKGLKKLAVYKDKQGKLHTHSAVCPHLGGIVRWNEGEKSWDCPCHGSRFDALGRVITGPANSNLI